MARRANLFTIPPGVPFLETLVDALLDGRLVPGFAPRHDPLALSSATLYLPTRRAIRALREVFLDRLGGGAALLPRLLALGEVDDEEASFDEGALPLPPAVGGLDRQIALTRLILAWSASIRSALLPLPGEDEPLLIPSSPGDAAGLAADLARFLDGLEIDRVAPQALAGLADLHAGRYDRYWDITARFLAIATQHWPAFLAAAGSSDPVARRNAVMAGEIARLCAGTAPVIVAGSTGSIPSTRDLIVAVAARPLGAVVLPGLDLDLDALGWQAIGEGEGSVGHPQAGLRTLIGAIGAEREGVASLAVSPPPLALRAHLVSQALRPAQTTEMWRAAARPPEEAVASAFAGVALVEAASEGEEALAIALALREALELPGRTAALLTPDRLLASRVVAELGRWGVEADDSAGRPLMATPPGLFTRLVLDVALTNFAPVPLLALLKHPFATLGGVRDEVRRAAQALEIAALRGPLPPPGLAGLRTAQAAGEASLAAPHAPQARQALSAEDWQAAAALIEAVGTALAPLADCLRRPGAQPASAFFAAHRAAVEAAAGEALYAEADGKALADLFVELAAVQPGDLALPAVEYPGLFAALVAGRSVRGGEPRHPRLSIYGLLEARLLAVDRLVLGGLDEGIWPPQVRTDPWLNRPMRAAIGLAAPEKRIGLAAHDFEQALGAHEVVITRALKRGGAPAVPSRWLQRLEACLGTAFQPIRARGTAWCDLARVLDRPAQRVAALPAPAPRPPLNLRPDRLSVTQIEHLVRDPYTIYARHILKLEALPALAEPPGAADRGQLVHEAAWRFATLCAEGVPADAMARLEAIGAELFAGLADYPDVQAFWQPRFARIAAFLVDWETRRRPSLTAVHTEIAGKINWTTIAGRSFRLSARADRIEADASGLLRVLDFKTGRPPTAPQIQTGIMPQIALELAILLESGFAEIKPGALAPPVVVRLGGGADNTAETILTFKDASPEEVATQSLDRLKKLIDAFEDPRTPYLSLLHPMFKTRRYGDYDHLARVREWSLAADQGGGEE